MKILRGYKTELELNNQQRSHSLKHAGAARYAYNWGWHGARRPTKLGEKGGLQLTCIRN